MERRTINFNEKKSAKEEKKRKSKYADIMVRATIMGLMVPMEDTERMMDIESADKKFHLRLEAWLSADAASFRKDFNGIKKNINRSEGFPATDFGSFVPIFAEKKEK